MRLGFALLLLMIVPACTPADSTQPVANRQAPTQDGNHSAIHTAFYQAGETEQPDKAAADTTAESTPELTPPSVDQTAQLLAAVEQLQSRVDELQNQNQQILAALGVDDQQPAPPPPSGSLAEKVIRLQESVETLAANDEAIRRAIEEQTVALKPALPSQPMQGKLVVENNTDSDRQIWINGTEYWIWAGSELSVQVPVGVVTTKVMGEEARTWEIGEPNLEERIEIVRRSAVTFSGN